MCRPNALGPMKRDALLDIKRVKLVDFPSFYVQKGVIAVKKERLKPLDLHLGGSQDFHG